MTAINHALTGAFIGFIVVNPLAAIPLAIVSHFVLDGIPHFGFGSSPRWFKSKNFHLMLVIDGLLCIGLVLLLAYKHPENWLLAATCAFLAASPDLLHINEFYSKIRNKNWKPNLYTKFAAKIQWFEKPIGTLVEIAWFGAITIMLVNYL